MLEDVLAYINNRFERGTVSGTFTVSNGTMEVAGAQEGQYFWVEGSVFNDGLHRYPDKRMADETFTGNVVLLAVPKAVITIAADIEAWCEEHAETLEGPYKSESFGGYTYQKEDSVGADGGYRPVWASKFGPRLRRWRKLSKDWG